MSHVTRTDFILTQLVWRGSSKILSKFFFGFGIILFLLRGKRLFQPANLMWMGNTQENTASNYKTPQHTATHCNKYFTKGAKIRKICKFDVGWQRTAAHCNALQHTATNTLQHAATNILQGKISVRTCKFYAGGRNIARLPKLPHTATHCNTMQCIATHCNKLQHTATRCKTQQRKWQKFLQAP